MRLAKTNTDRNFLGAFERREAIFVRDNGHEIRFFFIVPHEHAGWLSDGADHWFVLGATSAAILGESYSQDEPVAVLLRRNIDCLIQQWAAWYPWSKPVAIDVPVSAPSKAMDGEAKQRALFYTGGVDSTFTFAMRASETDVLIKAVFDWDDEEVLANQLLAERTEIAGKRIVPVGTNVLRAFPEFADAWAYRTHGPALGSVAHLLSRDVGKAIFSSSHTFGELIPWGSHPLTDPLLSSDSLTFEHYGTQYSRIEKIKEIARNPGFVGHLDVCGQIPSVKQGRINCSCCKKCQRTMIAIDTSGIDKADAASFDWSRFGPEQIARIRLHNPNEYPVFRELRDDARRSGRDDLADAIDTAISKSYVYYPLGAAESFLRRRFASQIVRRPIFRQAKRTLFRLRERWT